MQKLALGLAAFALAQTTYALVTEGASPPDGIGSLIAAYQSVAPLLPPHGVVGYLETSSDPDFNTVNYYVAQQALAPRILSREAAPTADVVITTTATPESFAANPSLDDLTLIATGRDNVRVFHRKR